MYTTTVNLYNASQSEQQWFQIHRNVPDYAEKALDQDSHGSVASLKLSSPYHSVTAIRTACGRLMGISSVPLDILLEIFKLYAKDHKKLSARASVKLTHVCHDWRNSACNGMPSLWAEIKIEEYDFYRRRYYPETLTFQRLVSAFLERSFQCPLILDIDLKQDLSFPDLLASKIEPEINSVVSDLMKHCYRWQKVKLSWNQTLPQAFLSKSGISMPCLNCLSLDVGHPASKDPIHIFQNTPSLTDLHTFGIRDKAILKIDWSLITSLECSYAALLHTCCDSRMCPKLKRITLSDRLCQFKGSSIIPEEVVFNDTIEEMTLTYEGCEPLLAVLILPSLQRLYILECNLYVFSPALLYNVQNPIQFLHLSCSAIEKHMEKLHSILTAPSIQGIDSLVLGHRYTFDVAANFSLISGLLLGKDKVLTNLKNLTFVFENINTEEYNISDDETKSYMKNGLQYYRHTEQEALAVVNSRWDLAQHSDLPDNVQRLQSFTFRAIGFGRRLSKGFKEAMDRLKEQGLEVRIEMIDEEEEMWVLDEWMEGEERPMS